MKLKCDGCAMISDSQEYEPDGLIRHPGRGHQKCPSHAGVWRKAGPEADAVNHPAHYTDGKYRCAQCGHHIECIEVTRHLNFNRGNAVKYIWRAGAKNPAKELEDLQKAHWYISDEIGRLMGPIELAKYDRPHATSDVTERGLYETVPGVACKKCGLPGVPLDRGQLCISCHPGARPEDLHDDTF